MFFGQESRNPRNRAFPLYDISARVPPLASMTQVNVSGSGSVSQNPGKALILQESGTATVQVRGLAYPAPTTPYRISLLMLFDAFYNGFESMAWGWYNPTSGKIETVSFGADLINPNANPSFQYNEWSAATTRASYTNLTQYHHGWSPVWLGIHCDGTNMIWEVSQDGATYLTVKSETIASSYLGSGNITDIFFGITDFGESNAMNLTCLCFDPNGLSRVAGG